MTNNASIIITPKNLFFDIGRKIKKLNLPDMFRIVTVHSLSDLDQFSFLVKFADGPPRVSWWLRISLKVLFSYPIDNPVVSKVFVRMELIYSVVVSASLPFLCSYVVAALV
jgi:hypothetical protein